MDRDRLDTSITLRLSVEDRQTIERMAAMERRTPSAMIRIAILEAAARRGLAQEEAA